MNRDQIKGGMKEAAGKAQKEFGKAVDSPKHQIQGGVKEVAGKTEKAVGDMKETMNDARKDADREAGKRGFWAYAHNEQEQPGSRSRAVSFRAWAVLRPLAPMRLCP